MKKFVTLLTSFTLLIAVAHGQKRYLDEVFTDFTVIPNQIYAGNVTVETGVPAADTLRYDLYMPAGDTCGSRPLVVVLPTGTFLPKGLFAPTGDKDDYACVRTCELLAKRGYIAAAIQYRVGWNPVSPQDTTRRSTIINAAYRSIQDLYSFLRFMNMTVDDLANPYNVDMGRVAVYGIGTGGFVGLNAAVLSQEEIYIDKFRNPVSGKPYVDTLLSGDLHGIKPAPLNIPNHVGYADDFHYVFSLDGAIGDSTWIEDGESVPLTVAGTVTHPTTPYGIDPISGELNCDLPVYAGAGTGIFVVNIAGSACVMTKANMLGINDPLNIDPYNDAISVALRGHANNFGQEHLWAINLPGPQAGPWEYWDPAVWSQVPFPLNPLISVHDAALATNPDMSMAKANAYIDTAVWFFAPRSYQALKLGGVICSCDNVNPDPLVVNDFECRRNVEFGAGSNLVRILDNPDPNADNSSEKVAEYRDPANDPWAALCLNFEEPIDLSVYNRFDVQVWAPGQVQILFKLEGGTSPAYETWIDVTAPNTWETLSADFSSQSAANHTRVCMFPNGGVGQPTEDRYYMDNMRWEMSSSVFTPQVDALSVAPNPTTDVLYVRNPGEATQIRVMNQLGQIVLNQRISNQEIAIVDMNMLPQGMYLVGAYDVEGKLIGNAKILKN